MKIRYYGHFDQTGYGRAAIENVMSLIAAGCVVEVRPLMKAGAMGVKIAGVPASVVAAFRNDRELSSDPDVIIVHELPGDCMRVKQAAVEHVASCPMWIAFTTWEALTAPIEMVELIRKNFDLVWVPSSANQTAFVLPTLLAHTRDDNLALVKVLPHAFDASTIDRRRSAPMTARRPFRFYYVGAWNGRKNVSGLVRAWAMAFTKDDDVELVLHCPGTPPQACATAIGMTGLTPPELAPIRLVNTWASDGDILALHAGMDCFVSASRGDGWNLGAFDAVLAGRHVITTRGLGSDDFLSDTSGDLVIATRAPAAVDVRVLEQNGNSFNLERVGAQGLTSRSVWSEPDLLSFASCMRGVAKTGLRDLRVHYDILRYSHEEVGKLAVSHIKDIRP